MPRVQVNNRKYKEKDLKNFIRSRAIVANVQLQEIAAVLGIERTTLYRHLSKGKVEYGELVQIIDVLKLSDADVLNLMRLNEKTK